MGIPIPPAMLGTGHPVLHPAWALRSKAGGPAPQGLWQLGLSEPRVPRANCEPVQRYRCLRIREAPGSKFIPQSWILIGMKAGCCLRLDLQKPESLCNQDCCKFWGRKIIAMFKLMEVAAAKRPMCSLLLSFWSRQCWMEQILRGGGGGVDKHRWSRTDPCCDAEEILKWHCGTLFSHQLHVTLC